MMTNIHLNQRRVDSLTARGRMYDIRDGRLKGLAGCRKTRPKESTDGRSRKNRVGNWPIRNKIAEMIAANGLSTAR